MVAKDMPSKPRIGFIGMGRMGSHMALRLLAAGYSLCVYDRTKEKTQPLAQRGATVAETPRSLAENSNVIMSSVTDDVALEAVMYGSQGVLAGAQPGAIIINMSTVSPKASRHLFEAAREKDIKMIDSPVLGSVPQVEDGSLMIFVGGEQKTYEACKPILDVLGKKNFYLGPSGMGSIMKLVTNTLLGLGLQTLAEALALGEKAGLQRAQLIELLKQTTIISPRQKVALENAERREYPANFPLPLMFKDFGLIISEASELAVPMPATAAANQTYAVAENKGINDDATAIIRVMEELAGAPEH